MTTAHRDVARLRLAAAQQDLMRETTGTPLCRDGDSTGTKYAEGRVTALRQALRGSATTGSALEELLEQWRDDATSRLVENRGWRAYLDGGIHELRSLAGDAGAGVAPANPLITEG